MLIGLSGVNMQRRTLLKQLGTASAVAVGFSGSAAAAPEGELGIDRQIDVSNLEGAFALAELLDDVDLEALHDDVDPWEVKLDISAEAESVNPASTCGDPLVDPFQDFCTVCCGSECFCVVCCCVNC